MSKQAALKKSQSDRTAEVAPESQSTPAEGAEKPRSALSIALVALLILVGLIFANMR